MIKNRSRILSAIGITLFALFSNIIILQDLPLLAQTVAALILTGLLPGFLLVDLLIGHSSTPPKPWAHALYTIGAGYACIVSTTLLISYLPGGITRWHTLITFNALILSLFLSWLYQSHLTNKGPNKKQPRQPRYKSRITNYVLALITLALVGGSLRFANLNYSEFQGDEARVMLRAAEVIQGHSDALLSHTKGPTEILIPTALYSLTNRISELPARLPFALANFVGLFAIFLLGTRMINTIAGWSAALLLALDGYMIGFAHIVQYQSIVFLLVVLTVLVLYRLAQDRDQMSRADQTRYLTLAAIFFATGLLSHYEAILVLPPCFYLVTQIWPIRTKLPEFWQAARIPILIVATIVGLFYIPFVLNPSFATTYAYITVNRIGIGSEEVAAATGGFPYNNFGDIWNRTTLYSSTYYFLFLIALGVTTIVGVFATKWWRKIEIQTILIWFTIPCILSLFFVATPNTHVYGFFIPWALLAALPISWFWQWINQRIDTKLAQRIGVAAAAALILLFGTYEYWLFAHTQTEILRTWPQNRPRGYWTTYDMPINRSIFGFPFQNGWKSVEILYANGTLNGAYETNANEAVAEWYTRGANQCDRDARYFIFSQRVEAAEAADLETFRDELLATQQLVGTITVNGEDRLQIFEKGVPPSQNSPPPFRYDNALYSPSFETDRTDPAFARHGSQTESQARAAGMIPLDFRFGTPDGPIGLRGYSLAPKVVQPSDEVQITLYWQSNAVVETRYTVFNQILNRENSRKAGQRDGEPVCDTLPTDRWHPGDLIADRYRVPVFPDAQPGIYATMVGLYDRETGSRLDIFTPDGTPVGDALGIDQVEVVAQ